MSLKQGVDLYDGHKYSGHQLHVSATSGFLTKIMR